MMDNIDSDSIIIINIYSLFLKILLRLSFKIETIYDNFSMRIINKTEDTIDRCSISKLSYYTIFNNCSNLYPTSYFKVSINWI